MKPAFPVAGYVLLLALTVGLVYQNALDGPFVLDDRDSIVGNPAIRRLGPLSEALNPPPAEVSFCTRPFINLTMRVNYAAGGLNPRGYHLANIAFHLAAVLTLFGLLGRTLRRLGLAEAEAGNWSFFCALIWAVHPLATAAVNYPSQRGELAIGFFFFLMLYGLDRAQGMRLAGRSPAANTGDLLEGERPREPKAASLWMALSVFACLLGMGSKENMIVAPGLALIYDRVFLSSSWKGLLRRRALYYAALAMTALWPVYRHLVYSPHLRHAGLQADTWWDYLFTQAWGLNRLIRLVFWPHPLVFDYGSVLIRSLAEVWAPAAGILFLLAVTGWALVRLPPWGFAGLCFFSFLAPSVFFPAIGQPIAEHRMYVPLASALVLMLMGLRLLARSRKWPAAGRYVLLGLAALSLGLMTRHRNTLYRSEVALYTDSIAHWPINARAYYCRGVARFLAGDLDGAWADYGRALELMPHYVKCRLSRAALLVQQNRFEAALADLDRAASMEPTAHVLAFRGHVLSRLKRYPEAAESLEQAVRSDPGEPKAWSALAWLRATAGDEAVRDGARAVQAAQEAVRLQPVDPAALDALAAAWAEAGRFDEAAAAAERALALARGREDDALADSIAVRLDSFRKGLPWRE